MPSLCCKDVKDDQKNKLLLMAVDFRFLFRLGGNKKVLSLGQNLSAGGMALPVGFVLFAIKSVVSV